MYTYFESRIRYIEKVGTIDKIDADKFFKTIPSMELYFMACMLGLTYIPDEQISSNAQDDTKLLMAAPMIRGTCGDRNFIPTWRLICKNLKKENRNSVKRIFRYIKGKKGLVKTAIELGSESEDLYPQIMDTPFIFGLKVWLFYQTFLSNTATSSTYVESRIPIVMCFIRLLDLIIDSMPVNSSSN